MEGEAERDRRSREGRRIIVRTGVGNEARMVLSSDLIWCVRCFQYNMMLKGNHIGVGLELRVGWGEIGGSGEERTVTLNSLPLVFP